MYGTVLIQLFPIRNPFSIDGQHFQIKFLRHKNLKRKNLNNGQTEAAKLIFNALHW